MPTDQYTMLPANDANAAKSYPAPSLSGLNKGQLVDISTNPWSKVIAMDGTTGGIPVGSWTIGELATVFGMSIGMNDNQTTSTVGGEILSRPSSNQKVATLKDTVSKWLDSNTAITQHSPSQRDLNKGQLISTSPDFTDAGVGNWASRIVMDSRVNGSPYDAQWIDVNSYSSVSGNMSNPSFSSPLGSTIISATVPSVFGITPVNPIGDPTGGGLPVNPSYTGTLNSPYAPNNQSGQVVIPSTQVPPTPYYPTTPVNPNTSVGGGNGGNVPIPSPLPTSPNPIASPPAVSGPNVIPSPPAVSYQQVSEYQPQYERTQPDADCRVYQTIYIQETVRVIDQNGSEVSSRLGSRFVHPLGANQYTSLNLSENPSFWGYDRDCLASKQSNSGGGGVIQPPPIIPGGGGTSNPPNVPPTNVPPIAQPPYIPPTPTGIVYTAFDMGSDVIMDRTYVSTVGLFSGNSGSLYDFYTGSSMTTEQKKYYYEIYQSQSTACAAEAQFSIVYGDRNGSGSVYDGGNSSVSPTKAMYSQMRMLCLGETSSTFTFSTGSTTVDSDRIYAISFNRDRLSDKLDPGNWQLSLVNLDGSSYSNSAYTGSHVSHATSSIKVITLIDDSGDSDDSSADTGITSPVYNVVSGSIANGVYNSTTGTGFGLVYPDLGIIVLNATKLDYELSFNSVTGSNIAGDNAYKLFVSMKQAAQTYGTKSTRDPFVARNSTLKMTAYYFARVKTGQYNFSNNPTFVTGSLGQFRHKSFEKDPKTYITGIGLYNDRYELLAIGKMSQPIQKSFYGETLIKVRLNF